MTPIPSEAPSFSASYIAAILVGGLIIGAISPFVIVGVYLFLKQIWKSMIKDPEKYQEWNRIRKVWNKSSARESRRQHIALCYMDGVVDEQGLSEEERFRYDRLIQNVYFPARRKISHRLVITLYCLWPLMQYRLFGTGKYKNFNITPEEWSKARARATAEPENELAFFDHMFNAEFAHASQGTSTPMTVEPGSGSRIRTAMNPMNATPPPPYSP